MTCPRAILVGGAPATGKSTLATALAPRLGAAILDLDTATLPLTTVISTLIGVADLADPRIARLTRTPRYDTLFALARDILRAGLPVVLVAPFTTERSLDRWPTVSRRLGTEATLVWLHLPKHLLIERLARRNAARDADKMAHPETFLAGLDHSLPAGPHLAVDAAAPTADQVDLVLAHLAHQRLAIDGKGPSD
jgi:predicted kinase